MEPWVFAFKFEVHTKKCPFKTKPFNRQTVISINQLFKVLSTGTNTCPQPWPPLIHGLLYCRSYDKKFWCLFYASECSIISPRYVDWKSCLLNTNILIVTEEARATVPQRFRRLCDELLKFPLVNLDYDNKHPLSAKYRLRALSRKYQRTLPAGGRWTPPAQHRVRTGGKSWWEMNRRAHTESEKWGGQGDSWAWPWLILWLTTSL